MAKKTAAQRARERERRAAERQREQIRLAARDAARGPATGGVPGRRDGRPQSPFGTPITSLFDLPAGSFDPSIVYQSGAANRGLGYQSDDYNIAFAGADTGFDSRPADLLAQNPDGSYRYGRAIRDYWQNRDRASQQFDWQRDDTARGYRDLGNNQLQAINQAGVLGGGALAQALAKRTTNEARDQERIETGRRHSLSDLLLAGQRGATDAYTGLQRAVGENAPYQATLFQQAAAQAAGSLAGNPSYEYHNGVLYQRTPSGALQVAEPTGGAAASGGATGGQPTNPMWVNQGTGGIQAPAGLASGGQSRPSRRGSRYDDPLRGGRPSRRRSGRNNTGGFVY